MHGVQRLRLTRERTSRLISASHRGRHPVRLELILKSDLGACLTTCFSCDMWSSIFYENLTSSGQQLLRAFQMYAVTCKLFWSEQATATD